MSEDAPNWLRRIARSVRVVKEAQITQEDLLEFEELDRIEAEEAEIARTRREVEFNG